MRFGLSAVLFLFVLIGSVSAGYVSIHQINKEFYYCSASEGDNCFRDESVCGDIYSYKCKITLRGFKNQYDYCDPRILCGKDLNWGNIGECYVYGNGNEKEIWDVISYPSETSFRVFVPPRSEVTVSLSMGRDAQIGAVFRFGEPPVCEYCSYSAAASAGVWSGATLNYLPTNDVYLINGGGYLGARFRVNNDQGGWLYVKLLISSGTIYQLTFGEIIDLDAYFAWRYGDNATYFCDQDWDRVMFSSCGDPLSWEATDNVTVVYIDNDSCEYFTYGTGISSGGDSGGTTDDNNDNSESNFENTDSSGSNSYSSSCNPIKALLGWCTISDSQNASSANFQSNSCNPIKALLGWCNLQEGIQKHFPNKPEIRECDINCMESEAEFKLKKNSGKLTLKAEIPKFDRKVNIYMAVFVPNDWVVGWDEDGFYACELDSGTIKKCYRNCKEEEGGTVVCEEANMIYPFKRNLGNGYAETLLDNVQINCGDVLPSGIYYLYWLIVPEGKSLDNIDWDNDPYILKWIPFDLCE